MDQKLFDKLTKRELEGTLRSLSFAPDFTDFYSNDFLGMSRLAFSTSLKGSTGSRLISGHSSKHDELEQEIADYFKDESSLFFESGYSANLGFFACVPQRGDLVLFDEECHASIRDGLRLCYAETKAFRHNDLDHLTQLLEKNKRGAYIVVEGLYSISGTIAPLIEVLELAEKFGSFVVIDEAHSSGVLGKIEKGLSFDYPHPALLARLVTFGKAYGASGAVFLCSKNLRNYLINFCRSFIYTTAAPIGLIEKASHQLKSLNSSNFNQLKDNLDYFQLQTRSWDCQSAKNSPIKMIQFDTRNKLINCVNEMNEKTIAVKAIYAPTVKEANEGMRIILHSFNTKSEIDLMITIVEKYL